MPPGRPPNTPVDATAKLLGIEEATRIADEQNARRKAAPNVTAAMNTAAPQKELERIHVPECVDEKNAKGQVTKKAPMHGMYIMATPEEIREYALKGYKPSKSVIDGKPVMVWNSIHVQCPVEQYEQGLEVAVQRSKERLADPPEGDKGVVTETMTPKQMAPNSEEFQQMHRDPSVVIPDLENDAGDG